MIKEMTDIAAECFKHPGRKSVWSPRLQKYICPDSEEAAEVSITTTPPQETAKHPPINQEFKLVFVTAAVGTLIFVVLCLTMTLLAGREPHPLYEKVIIGRLRSRKDRVRSSRGTFGRQEASGGERPQTQTLSYPATNECQKSPNRSVETDAPNCGAPPTSRRWADRVKHGRLPVIAMT
jgi:hypothetical protein